MLYDIHCIILTLRATDYCGYRAHRRDISTQSEGALNPVLKYAMSQLHGAMVTGWHGNYYNGWPEENQ